MDVRYALEGTGGVLGPWTIVAITRPKQVTISGLTLAGIYQFQIRALGVRAPDRVSVDGLENESDTGLPPDFCRNPPFPASSCRVF